MSRDCKHGQLARACDRCADEREIAELRRWKSTHAPRLAALEGLLHTAQADAHAGREAIATLASELAANAMLTDEIDRLRADRDMLRDALAAILVRVNQPSFGMGRDIRELAETALKPNVRGKPPAGSALGE